MKEDEDEGRGGRKAKNNIVICRSSSFEDVTHLHKESETKQTDTHIKTLLNI